MLVVEIDILEGTNIVDSSGGVWGAVDGDTSNGIKIREIKGCHPPNELIIKIVDGNIVDAETGAILSEFQ